MSVKATPQIQKSATPIPTVATPTALGSVRAFTDETTIQEQESSSTDSQAVAAASPPPEEGGDRTPNSSYNFSRISVADYVPATVQTKLVVGAPGDKYEQEADVMADKVMSMTPSVQKQEELIEEKPEIQAQPVAETVQPQTDEDGTVHLKPVVETLQRQTDEDGTVHLKPIAETLQRQTDEDGTVHLKPIAENSQKTEAELIPATVQTKLVVGAPGDKYEQEADRMADQVVSMKIPVQKQEELTPTQPEIQTKALAETIQRKEIEGVVHLKAISNQISPEIQLKIKQSNLISRKGNGGFTASDSIENRLKSSKGSGQPLPDETRTFMEDRFGNDFGGVKIHTGSDSVQLSKDLGAQAFTHGQDVYFNSGKYSPNTDEGKKLLAHELTHTIQQTGPKIKKKTLKRLEKPNKIQGKEDSYFTEPSLSQVDQISRLKVGLKIQSASENNKAPEASDKDKNQDKDKEKVQDKKEEKTDNQNPASPPSKAKGDEKAEDKAEDRTENQGGAEGATEGAKEGTVAGGQEATVEPVTIPQDKGETAPNSPQEDPAFQAVVKQSENTAKQYNQHQPSQVKANEAQQAAEDPNKQKRDAEATKVEETSQQKTKPFDRATFEKAILDKLGLAVPKNLEQANNFSKNNKLGEVQGELTKKVEQNKQEAAGGLPQANKTPPDPSAKQPKPVEPIPDIKEDIGKQQPIIEADKAVPKEKSDKEIEAPLKQTAENLDETFGEVQAKLVVGSPGDKYEQEADQMAEKVMAMPAVETTEEVEPARGDRHSQPEIQSQTEPANNNANNNQDISPAETIENERLLAESIQRSHLLIQRKVALEAQQVEQPHKEVPLNTNRLETWGEMGGSQAINALKDTKKQSTEGPKEYRQQEETQVTTARGEAVGMADQSNQEMFNDRTASMTEVATNQEQTKTEDEKKREKVTADIEKIYKQTKDSVDGRLKKLDADVDKEFKRGSDIAKRKFEGYVAGRMAAYKRERYSGLKGKWRWVRDLFKGLPNEVNSFYEEGKNIYLDEMKKSVSKLAEIVETGLNEAKQLVDKGRQQVNDYVTSLPEDIKQVGAESAANIQSKFDGLEQSIHEKQAALVDSLAQKYQENLKELDKRIEKLKEENKGLVDKVLDAIADLAKAIIKAVLTPIKWLLEPLLGGMAGQVIDAIINDPIGFMKNLFKGIGDGLKQFVNNVGKHLLNGLVTWLFGNIGSDLKLPKEFNLKGFLDLLLQILGLTTDNIFGIAEQFLGSNIVGLIKFIIDFVIQNGTDSLKVLWDLVKVISQVGIDVVMMLIEQGAEAIESLPETAQNIFKSLGVSVETLIGFAGNMLSSLGGDVFELVGGLGKGAKLLFDFFSSLIKDGLSGIWNFMKSSIGTLKEIFMKDLSEMLIVEVVKQGVVWLIGMLNPASGLAKIAKAIVDVVQFFIEKKEQIKALVDSILNTLKSIIDGNPGEMANMIETALANAIPTLLGFLASVLGIGGIPAKIQKIFTKLKEPVTKVVTTIFDKGKAFFKAIGKAVKKGYNKAKKAVKKGYNKAKKAVKKGYNKIKGKIKQELGIKDKNSKDNAKKRLATAQNKTQELVKKVRDPKEVEKQLPAIASQHKIDELKVKKGGVFGSSSKYEIVGKTKQLKAPAKTKPTKVQRQIEPGTKILQLKKENPWKNPKNQLIVKSQLKGDKKKANFTLKAKVLTSKKVLKDLAKKLKKLVKSKVTYKNVEKGLPELKQRYQVQSLTIAPENKEKTKYQIQAIAPKEESTQAQREAIPGATSTVDGTGVEEAIERSQGKGQQLAPNVRAPMENAFGFDFSSVRIHADTEGDRLSRSLEARAFTTGSDVFFRQGAYAPESQTGQRLLAHELTHVVQQSGESPQVAPSNPLLSRTVQRVSEEAPSFVQREAEGNSNGNAEVKKAERKALAIGAVAVGASMALDYFTSNSNVNVSSNIQGNKLTMKVKIEQPKQQEQQKKKQAGVEDNQALPDDLVYDIVKLIQQIVNQYPNPDIVQKKLDRVAVDFDLELLKIVGSATIGDSFTYDIQIKGRPQKPPQEDTASLAKNLERLTPQTEPKAEKGKSEGGSLWGSLFSKNSQPKSDAKTKEPSLTKASEKPQMPSATTNGKDPKVKAGQPEKQETTPKTTKEPVVKEEKEKKATEELKEEAKTSQKPSPNKASTEAKQPLDVNTKVKRTDPATVEISVRADRKK
ncbi:MULTISPECIES: eCIS core domain-containing protein [unclassified Microcoleus]|uniref:eCIS core domain-containing protein n=1 Tax=unclassified Microcoleus TaxID=2642155 RepID=UPI002FD2BE9B